MIQINECLQRRAYSVSCVTTKSNEQKHNSTIVKSFGINLKSTQLKQIAYNRYAISSARDMIETKQDRYQMIITVLT